MSSFLQVLQFFFGFKAGGSGEGSERRQRRKAVQGKDFGSEIKGRNFSEKFICDQKLFKQNHLFCGRTLSRADLKEVDAR